jgi:DNA helicase-2/ATP-dependent DNA helicase PcrA
MSIPSRFLEEVPSQLVENLGSRPQPPSWSTPGYPNTYRRKPGHGGDFADKHYNYEDESQETQRLGADFGTNPKSGSAEAPKRAEAPQAPNSIDNIARFFGGKAGGGKSGMGKPGSLPRPAFPRPLAVEIGLPTGAAGLKKGHRVRHGKYGEGTVIDRVGDGEDAKLTVLFNRHGMKKLMEKFANLQKI